MTRDDLSAALIAQYEAKLDGQLEAVLDVLGADDTVPVLFRHQGEDTIRVRGKSVVLYGGFTVKGLGDIVTLGEAIAYLDIHRGHCHYLAENFARAIALLVPTEHWAAIVDRNLPAQAPWGISPHGAFDLVVRAVRNSAEPPRKQPADIGEERTKDEAMVWPSAVAPRDVVIWAQGKLCEIDAETADEWARPVLEGSMLPRRFTYPDSLHPSRSPHYRQTGELVEVTPLKLADLPAEGLDIAGGDLALIYQASQEIEGAAKYPTVQVPAHSPGRALVRMMGNPSATKQLDLLGGGSEARVTLKYQGTRYTPVRETTLDDIADPITQAVIDMMTADEQEDGLRDYFTLLMMAQEQNHSAHTVWTIEDHLRKGGYQDRIQRRVTTKAEASSGIYRRLQRMAQTRIMIQYKDREDQPWFQLVTIPAGVARGGQDTQLVIQLAPILLGAVRKHFILVTHEAMTLSGPALRMFVLSLFMTTDQRKTIQDDRMISFKTPLLLEMAGIEEPRPQRRKDKLDKLLREIEQATGFAYSKHGTDEAGHQIYSCSPPQTWRDRALSGIKPAAKPLPQGLPQTGAALKTWRKAQELSVRQVAEGLAPYMGKSPAAVQAQITRAERNETKAIPRRLFDAIAEMVKNDSGA